MKDKFINLKKTIISSINNLCKNIKVNKKVQVVFIAIIIVLILIIVLCATKKTDNQAQNLGNLGFTVDDGKVIYCLDYNIGATDGRYKI